MTSGYGSNGNGMMGVDMRRTAGGRRYSSHMVNGKRIIFEGELEPSWKARCLETFTNRNSKYHEYVLSDEGGGDYRWSF